MEKSLMLGKIEGRRRRGQQRMRWLDGISDSVDTSFSKLWEMLKDREVWRAIVAKSQTHWATEQQQQQRQEGSRGGGSLRVLPNAGLLFSMLTPNGDCRTLVRALTPTSYAHGRVKKERRSSHGPPLALSVFVVVSCSHEDGLDSGVMGW